MHDTVHRISVMTSLVLLGVIVFVGAYDLIVGMRFGRTETVSYQMVLLSQEWPVIPLVAGLILGHIFWPQGPVSASGFAGHIHQRSTDLL